MQIPMLSVLHASNPSNSQKSISNSQSATYFRPPTCLGEPSQTTKEASRHKPPKRTFVASLMWSSIEK